MTREWTIARALLVMMLVCFSAAGILLVEEQTVRAEQGHIYYVKEGASGGGSAWADAFGTLQEALDAAVAGDAIWIAEGTYQPTKTITAGGQTFPTFQLKNGVEIYGGFAGVETSTAERDWTAHPTRLSNSTHVFYNMNVDTTAVLDGVTITGIESFSSEEIKGAGMYNEDSHPTIRNVVISDNFVLTGSGVGMYNLRSSPTISDVTITNNTLQNGKGIGIYNDNSSPTLTNVVISNNKMYAAGPAQGGGMYNVNGSQPVLVDVTISTNESMSGGGIYNDNSSPQLSNVTLNGNRVQMSGGGIYNVNSAPKLKSVTIQGNFALNQHGAGMYNDGSRPTVEDLTVIDNEAYGGNGGGLYLTNGSELVLISATINGNQAAKGGGIYNNGSLSLEKTEIQGNRSSYGGGMYNDHVNPGLKEVQFIENYANESGGGMYNDHSQPTLEQVSFDRNSAEDFSGISSSGGGGGGIYNLASSPELDRVDFNENTTKGDGGGIFNTQESNPILNQVKLTGNEAVTGGGMYNYESSRFEITDSEFSNNHAQSGGGGIYNDKSSPVLKNVEILSNTATFSDGGGMSNNNGSNATLDEVRFAGNWAINFNGGGINNSASSPIMRNVLLSGNNSFSGGSGIHNVNSNPELVHVTVSGNLTTGTTNGTGVWNDRSNPVIHNSVIWGNRNLVADGDLNNVNSANPVIAGSLIGPPLKKGPDGLTVNLKPADIFVDPKAPGSNPTVDGNYRLRKGSRAIDAGDNQYAAGLATDLDGQARQVRTVDIGAYENQTTVDAALSMITVLPNQVLADGTEKSTIKVNVIDSEGEPFKGVRVTLLQGPESHSVIEPATGMTDGNGEVTFAVTDTSVESVEYRAYVDGEEIGQPVTVQFAAGDISVARSTVTADSSSVLADGQEAAAITVKVVSESGHPAANQPVDLIADGGSSSISPVSGMTDGNGSAVFAVSDSMIESVTYTAQAGGVAIGVPVTVQFAAGDISAARSTVTADSSSVLADGQEAAAITVKVVSESGHPAANQPVDLIADGGSSSISPVSGMTDGNGTAVFNVTDHKVETVAYTAQAGGVTVGTPVTVQFAAGGISAARSTVTADSSSVLADGQEAAAIIVKVVSETGHPAANQPVDLIADGGSSLIVPVSGMTDGNGTAVFNVTDHKVETVAYTAQAGGVTVGNPVEVSFVFGNLSALKSSVVGDKASILADGRDEVTITAKIVSESGRAIPDQAVKLQADGGSSVIAPGAGMTDGNGTAVFTVTDSQMETVTYTTYADGVMIGSPVAVRFVAGDLSAVKSTTTADKTTVMADGQDASAITVTVVSQSGHPVQNQSVDLIADGGSSAIVPGAGMTDGNGTAVFTVTDSQIETVTYATYADGVRVGSSVTIQFVAGGSSTTKSTMTADKTTVLADGQDAAAITVTMVSQSGHPVQNQSVDLIADGGSSVIVPGTGITDANGTAVFTVTDSQIETVTYTAAAGGMTIGTPATVHFTAGPVSSKSSTVAASPLSVPADGISAANITVTVKDDYGHVLPGHGVELRELDGTGLPVVHTPFGTSDQDGQAAFTVTSATYGPFPFAAIVDGAIQLKETAAVYFLVGDTSEDHSSVAVDRQTVAADGVSAAYITVNVMDAYGHVLKDQRVTLIASGHSSMEPYSATTDGNGSAVFKVTGTEVETVTYRLVVNDAATGRSASVQFVAGPVSASHSSVKADLPSVTADGTSVSSVTVKLMDAFGHALPGRAIHLSGDGDSIIRPITGLSDEHGEAVFQATSASAGSVIYKATVEGTIVAETAEVQFVAATGLKASPSDVALQMKVNETQQLVVTAMRIDNPNLNVTEDSRTVYVSSDPAIATVSATGLMTAQNAGETTIEIRYVGASTTVNVRVSPAPSRSSNRASSAPSSSGPVEKQDNILAERDIAPDKPEELGQEDSVILQIPAGSMNESFQVSIERIVDPLTLQSLQTGDAQRVSEVYELLKSMPGNFEQPVTIKLRFDPEQVGGNRHPSIHYYDEDTKEWVEMGGSVSGNTIETKSFHFTKFAVFAVANKPQSEPSESVLPDIRSHWAETSIRQAVEAGFVNGYEDGTFRPNLSISRAEFIVMLTRVLKLEKGETALNFTDAGKLGAWARLSVAQAVRAGIISGYGDGSFRPQADVTRAELAVMLAKALALPTDDASASSFADDAAIPQWARGAVAALRELGIAEGRDGNRYDPAAPITRAEAAVILLRLKAHMP